MCFYFLWAIIKGNRYTLFRKWQALEKQENIKYLRTEWFSHKEALSSPSETQSRRSFPRDWQAKMKVPLGWHHVMTILEMRELTVQTDICEAHYGRNRDLEKRVYLPHFPTYVHLTPVSVHMGLILLLFIGFGDLCPCVCICLSHFCNEAVRSYIFSSSFKFPQYFPIPSTVHKSTVIMT